MYKALAIINVELGLRIHNRPNSPATSNVCQDSQAFYEYTVEDEKACTCMDNISKCCAPIGWKHMMQS